MLAVPGSLPIRAQLRLVRRAHTIQVSYAYIEYTPSPNNWALDMALRPLPSRAQVVLGPALGGGAAATLPEACPGAPLPPGGILRTMVEHACTGRRRL